MITLASLESLLGSVWACIALLAVGYLAGHVAPLGWVASLLKRGK